MSNLGGRPLSENTDRQEQDLRSADAALTMTLAEAIASKLLREDDVLIISDRAYGTFSVVLASGVTTNTFNIIQCVGTPTLALNLVVDTIANVRQFGATGDGTTDDTAAVQAAQDFVRDTAGDILRHDQSWDGRIATKTMFTLYFPKGKYKFTSSVVISGYMSLKGERAYVFSDSLTFKLFTISTPAHEISGFIFDGGTYHLWFSSAGRIESADVHIHDCEFRIAKEYCVGDDISVNYNYPMIVRINNFKSYGSSFAFLHNNGTFISDAWIAWDVSADDTDDNPLFDCSDPFVLRNITEVPFDQSGLGNVNKTPRIFSAEEHVPTSTGRALALTCENVRFGGEATETPILQTNTQRDFSCTAEFNGCAMFGVADYYWAEFNGEPPRRLVVKNMEGRDSSQPEGLGLGMSLALGMRVSTTFDPLDSQFGKYVEFGDDVPVFAQRLIVTDTRTGGTVPNDAVSANYAMNQTHKIDSAKSLFNHDVGNGFTLDSAPYIHTGNASFFSTVSYGGYDYRTYRFEDPNENYSLFIPGITPNGGAGIYSGSIDIIPQNGTCSFNAGYKKTAGAVLTNSITVGGLFVTSDGSHAFSMASTSGSGASLTGTLTITANTVASIDSIDSGSGYAATDTVVLSIPTATETTACTLTADTVSTANPVVINTANGVCDLGFNQITWKAWYNGTDPIDLNINISSIASSANTNIAIGRVYINKGVSVGTFVPSNTTTVDQHAKVAYGNAAPTDGKWTRGSRVWDENPSGGGFMGWVCVIAGSPGTWRTFGAISP